MFFPRRSGTASKRFLTARVGLFFLAAGVWLAGVIVADDRFTSAAIVILLVALALGFIGRRDGAWPPDDLEESSPEGEEPL